MLEKNGFIRHGDDWCMYITSQDGCRYFFAFCLMGDRTPYRWRVMSCSMKDGYMYPTTRGMTYMEEFNDGLGLYDICNYILEDL